MAYFPFGGQKDSFFGTLHGQGRDAVQFFTDSKVVVRHPLVGGRRGERGADVSGDRCLRGASRLPRVGVPLRPRGGGGAPPRSRRPPAARAPDERSPVPRFEELAALVSARRGRVAGDSPRPSQVVNRVRPRAHARPGQAGRPPRRPRAEDSDLVAGHRHPAHRRLARHSTLPAKNSRAPPTTCSPPARPRPHREGPTQQDRAAAGRAPAAARGLSAPAKAGAGVRSAYGQDSGVGRTRQRRHGRRERRSARERAAAPARYPRRGAAPGLSVGASRPCPPGARATSTSR